MKYSITFLLAVFFQANFSFAQKLVSVTEKSHHRKKEVYQVKREMRQVKHGSYKRFQAKRLVEKGFYKDGKKDSTWMIYSRFGSMIATGNYRDDERTGTWIFYSFNGELSQKYDYDRDSLLFNNQKEADKSSLPDTLREKMPIFIGGYDYMNTMIQNNLIYPKEALESMKMGTVYLTFVVEKDGSMSGFRSLRPLGMGLDEEAIRVMTSLGQAWIPGVQKGKLVRVQFNLPIKFSLQ